jgi:hypothetical protein
MLAFEDCIPDALLEVVEWLTALRISPPVLSKRHRSFAVERSC